MIGDQSLCAIRQDKCVSTVREQKYIYQTDKQTDTQRQTRQTHRHTDMKTRTSQLQASDMTNDEAIRVLFKPHWHKVRFLLSVGDSDLSMILQQSNICNAAR